MKLAILGVGSVGKAVAQLSKEYGHTVVALADSKNAIVNPSRRCIRAKIESNAIGRCFFRRYI